MEAMTKLAGEEKGALANRHLSLCTHMARLAHLGHLTHMAGWTQQRLVGSRCPDMARSARGCQLRCGTTTHGPAACEVKTG